MIKDATGRKWYMRFKQYKQGWQWEARCLPLGVGCGWNEFFATRALAEADARQDIQGHDHFAESAEYFRRLRKRSTECRLTARDWKAINNAGRR